MAHESFDDPKTAEVMNRMFVNIKVDREERPDIDQIHIAALAAMGERGGWPLTMFLTPQGQPFWGGTYFPPEPRGGRPSFVQILETVDRAWRDRKESLLMNAAALVRQVENRLAGSGESTALNDGGLAPLADGVHRLVDHEKGGIGGVPKFPNMPLMQTLWFSWLKDGTRAHRDDVLFSLVTMLAGGIYDHVGGGLCRYSTDAGWQIPHFEKMLYDNAQLLRLCNWANAETANQLFRTKIEETVSWLLREMRTEDGAFAASLDADSSGEEGLYYTWSEVELSEVAQGRNWQEFFTLAKPATWEGKPVLCQTLAQQSHSIERRDEVSRLKADIRAVQETRARPARDGKVLTDWNGLAIVALAECGRALGRADWIECAASAFESIAGSAADGRLPHSRLGEKRLFPALSSDYAATANAAVALFEATSDSSYLERARHYLRQLDVWHSDTTGSGYFLTAADAKDVPIRSRGDADDAIPSATAQIIEAMVRVGLATSDIVLQDHAQKVAECAAGRIALNPNGHAGIVNACAMVIAQRRLVIVDSATGPKLSPVADRYADPFRVDTIIGMNGQRATFPDIALPLTNQPGAYLCVGSVCLPPIVDPIELDEELRRRR